MITPRQAKKRSGYDPYLLLGVLLLMGIGMVLVYSASSIVAMKRFGSDTYFFNRQVVNVLVAILILICCRHVPYSFYRTLAYPIIAVAFLSLLALYLPHVGHSVGGARRWLKVFGVSFQPSEFARLGLIIFLAYSMSKKQERIKAFSIGFAPHAIVLGCFSALIVMEPDLGMAAMITLIVWIMLFVGGVRLSYLFAAIMGMVPLAYHVLQHVEYARERVSSFLDPWQHQSDAAYQLVHSLMAFGSGGIFGAGIGNGHQKLFYLPEPHTDFIFSVAGEEIGLMGICFITGLYFMILWRGFSIAMKADDLFATFLATGLTAAIGLQACVNAWVALGLLPTTGLTLPFVSYGGTSLVMCAAMIGILMNISARQALEGGKESNR
jgi:cell division protein FtsW